MITICPVTVRWYDLDVTAHCVRRIDHPGAHSDGLWLFDNHGIRVDGTDHRYTPAPPSLLHGERDGWRLLTVDQVLTIRRRYDAGEPVPVIARSMGMQQHNVANCARRRTYRDVTEQEEVAS